MKYGTIGGKLLGGVHHGKKAAEMALQITQGKKAQNMPIVKKSLAAELMRIRSNIPIILSTGYSKKISEEIASQIGIRAFADKPIVKADLAKTIRKVLDEAKTKSFRKEPEL